MLPNVTECHLSSCTGDSMAPSHHSARMKKTEALWPHTQTHLSQGQQPAVPAPHWAVKAPSQRQSSPLPQEIKGQSTSGEVPCQPPAPLATHTLWGQAQCQSAHSAGKARDTEPQHAGHSFLTAVPSHPPQLILSCAASLRLVGMGVPPPPPPIPETTVRLAPLQNCRQTLPPYAAPLSLHTGDP